MPLRCVLYGRPTIAICVGAAMSCSAAASGTFNLVGVAPGMDFSRVYAISANGSVAAGFSQNISMAPGFLWTVAGGRYDFVLDPAMPWTSQTYGVSANGSTATGVTVTTTSTIVAFRWSGPGTFQTLGILPGYTASYGEGISGDGSVVVGRSAIQFNAAMAFRWTAATGMQPLGYTPGHAGFSEARAISRNGSAIVGYSQSTRSGLADAFIWRQATGLQVLPQVPGMPSLDLYAYGTNFDVS